MILKLFLLRFKILIRNELISFNDNLKRMTHFQTRFNYPFTRESFIKSDGVEFRFFPKKLKCREKIIIQLCPKCKNSSRGCSHKRMKKVYLCLKIS